MNVGGFRGNGGSVMRNRVDIDEKTSGAIIREIGERLRAVVGQDPDVPASLRKQINRLRELKSQPPPIVPTVEHGFEYEPRRSVAVCLVVATEKLITEAREISMAVSMGHPIGNYCCCDALPMLRRKIRNLSLTPTVFLNGERVSKKATAMSSRTRIKHGISFGQRLANEAQRAREMAVALPPGKKRDALLEKGLLADLAARINGWLASPELKSQL
jgi:hypothetical protein